MRFSLVPAFGLALLASPLAAQSPAPTGTPDTTFYDATARPLPGRGGAARWVVRRREGPATVEQTFEAPGRLVALVTYADADRQLRDGPALRWYSSGQPQAREQYLRGVKDGQVTTFYPDGTLRRLEYHQQGRQVLGQCFAPDGSAAPFTAMDAPARYPGGEAELLAELKRKAELASWRGKTKLAPGKVYVGFQIDPTGQVQEPRVVRGATATHDEHALRLVRELKTWQPAHGDGDPVATHCTLEIVFP
ncbi:energy transducer TonB [Hymenobacter sp. B81]|uniref:energy transducer TonB n=1 Tax=Hymenobacter sp. B81 TaxID=3344878 RepID=UPI0037DD4B17